MCDACEAHQFSTLLCEHTQKHPASHHLVLRSGGTRIPRCRHTEDNCWGCLCRTEPLTPPRGSASIVPGIGATVEHMFYCRCAAAVCGRLPGRRVTDRDRWAGAGDLLLTAPPPPIHDDPRPSHRGSVASHRTPGTALHRLAELDALTREPSGLTDVVHRNNLKVEIGTELRRRLAN